MFDFRRITLLRLKKRFSKHKITKCAGYGYAAVQPFRSNVFELLDRFIEFTLHFMRTNKMGDNDVNLSTLSLLSSAITIKQFIINRQQKFSPKFNAALGWRCFLESIFQILGVTGGVATRRESFRWRAEIRGYAGDCICPIVEKACSHMCMLCLVTFIVRYEFCKNTEIKLYFQVGRALDINILHL